MALLATLLDATLNHRGRGARFARGTILVLVKDDGSVSCASLQRGTAPDVALDGVQPDVRLAGDTFRLEASRDDEWLLVEGRIHTLVRLDETGFEEVEPSPAEEAPRLAFRSEEPPLSAKEQEAFEALRAWRREAAKAAGVSAFIVASDRTLRSLARQAPASLEALRAVPGFGPAKTEKYGAQILAVLASTTGPQVP